MQWTSVSSLRIRTHLSWRTGKHLHVLHVLQTYSTCSYPGHPVTWIQRKSHRFGQSAHVDWGKIEQDPAGLVLTLKTWALYSVRCPGRRPSILMSHSHRHRNKKEGGWIYILSRSIKQWIVNNLFHAIKIKIACCLVSWVILCDNERYVMCSN